MIAYSPNKFQIDKIFCLHHTDAFYRKNNLIPIFIKNNVNVQWVEHFHPKDIDKSQLNITHKLTDAEISLFLKQKWCVEQQVEHGLNRVVILEDDVIIPDDLNFSAYLHIIFTEFEQMQGDVLNIGEAFGMCPTITFSHKYVYHEPHFTTRCAHAYALSLNCAKQIVNDLNEIDDAWDWKLNKMISKYRLKSCYVQPGLLQGSVQGIEASLLR